MKLHNDHMYNIVELKEELGVSKRTLLKWTELGMPIEPYSHGICYVNGFDFKQWLAETPEALKVSMPETQFRCFTCHKRVLPENGTIRLELLKKETCKGFQVVRKAVCPHCHKPLQQFTSRWITREQLEKNRQEQEKAKQQEIKAKASFMGTLLNPIKKIVTNWRKDERNSIKKYTGGSLCP